MGNVAMHIGTERVAVALVVSDPSYREYCSICLEEASCPFKLPCAHGFCTGCLASYILTLPGGGSRGAPCPNCKTCSDVHCIRKLLVYASSRDGLGCRGDAHWPAAEAIENHINDLDHFSSTQSASVSEPQLGR